MTAGMGLLSLGGGYSYQSGLSAVMAAPMSRNRESRSAIDAGYELNWDGNFIGFPHRGEDTLREEEGSMITSGAADEYTIGRIRSRRRRSSRNPDPGPCRNRRARAIYVF